MGVFKWLRRERLTVTTRHNVAGPTTPEGQLTQSETQIGTIRTEEYKRDLAEFQARRSAGHKELAETPVKKKCGRHSLPVSCTDCTADHDNTFNYEKKSAAKYKKHKRARSTTPDKKDRTPNIQFLFQNQVFMPGNMFPTTSYSEPQNSKRQPRRRVSRSPDMDFIVQRHIDFKDNDQVDSPEFFKNSSLPFDVRNFLEGSNDEEDVDGLKAAGDVKVSSQSECVDKNDSADDKLWEVMSELKHLDQWADEQLLVKSPNVSKSDDSKSDVSTYGLPIASARNLDVVTERDKVWSKGKWGAVPVQIKKLAGVTVDHVKKKRNTEINILRKCRHPNIILLMGLYPDINNNVHIICERCVDSLFGILHVQGRVLSVQTSVQFALDISNALVFLRMQGYAHTELASAGVAVTARDQAKLADLAPCVAVHKQTHAGDKGYDIYSKEPQYVNIEDTREGNVTEREPLLSRDPSETYIMGHAAAKRHDALLNTELYRWRAPELFSPDDDGNVFPCSKSDVYSLCTLLWECCNATIPWKTFTYEKLKEQYTLWKTGIPLPVDGTYPGCLLSLLQLGLKLDRSDRIDLETLQMTLQNVKRDIDELEYIVIPARLQKKKSNFSSVAWETTSPTDSECQSPRNIEHKAVVHKPRDSSTESSEKDTSKSDGSPVYETIRQTYTNATYAIPEKCFINDYDTLEKRPYLKYEHMGEKDYSSACSTPIAKIRARIKDIGTPGELHRSDSTEYCSILSPNRTVNFGLNEISLKDQSVERPTAKLSRSFTPKSYKPLHIKVPEYNLDSIKPLLRDQNSAERSSYNFDIKNYSLPTTPIARSNKLRKNAWLSGDFSSSERSSAKHNLDDNAPSESKIEEDFEDHSAPETSETPAEDIRISSETNNSTENSPEQEDGSETEVEQSNDSIETQRDCFEGLKRVDLPSDFISPEVYENTKHQNDMWSLKSSLDQHNFKYKIEEDILANVNVKPLVAIHERWIYEANRKSVRSMSLPEDNRSQIPAVKPASHCVDYLPNSLPQLSIKRPKSHRMVPTSPNEKHGDNWDQFCQARENIEKNINFPSKDPDRFLTWRKDTDKSSTSAEHHIKSKINQATDTQGIEDYIKELIRKEFQNMINEMSDEASTVASCNIHEDFVNKGAANIMETLTNEDVEKTLRKEPSKSFSRVKINGNNKPLLQITFSRSGENSLQVLDNCVNVTICDGNSSGREKGQSAEETLTAEDIQINSLKRCQAFNAIQEARSTEDLYIDDDLSTHMQENFGGKVKLIPLHGSLHEILCEKEDDCCLIKVKQENGCDTIYFRCDNSDTESRDAIDGCVHENLPQDTVVFKRSISLVEERIQRVFPKEKRAQTPVVTRKPKPNKEQVKIRPKSEIFIPIKRESRVLSNSSPSLVMSDKADEVEVNIENVMCYQDSSSDECLKCSDNDEFELLEQKIEEDLAKKVSSMTCGCLEKISEENLSVLNEDTMNRE